jgi:hypothetical protein
MSLPKRYEGKFPEGYISAVLIFLQEFCFARIGRHANLGIAF